MTLLCWLIKFLLCSYDAFIFEDHYFLCSFFQELGLRLGIKETSRQGLKPPTMLAPLDTCGLLRGAPDCDCGAALSSEVMSHRARGTATLFIGKPMSLETGVFTSSL